jgi:simple sugar transport system permease protein
MTVADVELAPAGTTRSSPRERSRRAGTIGIWVLLYVVSIAVALVLSALLVAGTGGSPSTVFHAMYTGALGDGAAIGLTIDQATPVMIVALGVAIAGRAGIINIGPEGQLAIGATVGAAVGLFTPGPGWLIIVLTLLGAAVGGAVWAGIAALMRFTRGVDVVISTLLLNFIADQVVSFAVNRTYLLRETAKKGVITSPESDQLAPDRRLPRIGHYPHFNVSTAVLVGIVVLLVVTALLLRSRWGFRLRMLGQNPKAARRAGVSMAVMGGGALVASGGLAGLAGGTMLTGSFYRVQTGFANNVGYNGLLAALIARDNPIAIVPVSLFFGALRSGGGFLAATGVPRYLVDIVQALLVLAALFPPVVMALTKRRRELRRARAAAIRIPLTPLAVPA